MEIWASKNGEYMYMDLEPKDLANWQSVVHSSRLAAAVEAEPGQAQPMISEVKNRLLVEIMEEVKREKPEEVDPSKQQEPYGVFLSIYSEELYSGEKSFAVCNNEEIHKILRKKKDGKCIYRIVVKNGARANRIYHGKHRKCIMYIDRQKSLS
jgi:hypothetical protein